MANILFFCNYQVAQPACGGIVRVTGTLAEIFSRHGHHCHLCYYHDFEGIPVPFFEDRLVLEQHKEENVLARYIEEKKIDTLFLQVPLNNTNWYLLPMLRKVVDGAKEHCTLIHCFHSIPFAECKGFDISYLRYMSKRKEALAEKMKKMLWATFSMLFPRLAVTKTSARYARICNYCDLTVLLSKRYLPFFTSHVKCDSAKVIGIGNPHTFPTRLTEEEIQAKTKTVVIVGRLDESTKRLSKAIRIWSIIENGYKVKDWSLVIVGDGADMGYYKHLAADYHTENITFAGKQNPVDYYRKASVLMSTSAIEGLPMVILEAEQMGCVPMAFDSFDTVHDLIDDSRNGFIVRYNDYEEYAARLYSLMTDETKRTAMMKQCLNGGQEFQPDVIYKEWEKILV